MLASPSLGRWLILAFGLVGIVYLIFYGRPPAEPLIGGLKGSSILTNVGHGSPVSASASPTNTPLSASPGHGDAAQIPGYEGPFISQEPGSPRLERSKIVKLTMLYYDNVTADTEAYERAMQSHVSHDDKFGYDHYILRRGLIGGLWTKQAEILHFLIQQLAKDPTDRYDWIFWHDADLVLVNHNIPLELFLPPPGREDIHFLIANDLSGYNAGVYFIRVHEWAVHFLAASLAYPSYHPDQWLIHDEQTAQDILLREPRWHNHTLHMPQRWFNAYHNFGTNKDVPPEWNWRNGYAEPGDMLVHFPGTAEYRSMLMDEWLKKKREEPALYAPPLRDTGYEANVTRFWAEEARHEREVQSAFWRHYKLLNSLGSQQDGLRDKEVEEAQREMADWDEEKVTEEVERVKEYWRGKKIEVLREAERKAVEEGREFLNEP